MKRAFTLIELLVVIAIIAILAAILFPVFAQAKAAAKKTVALSNVKQIATANMLYGGDNDDQLNRKWWDLHLDLLPYVKSIDLFTDPASSSPKPVQRDFTNITLTDGTIATGKFWTNVPEGVTSSYGPWNTRPTIFGHFARNDEILANYGFTPRPANVGLDTPSLNASTWERPSDGMMFASIKGGGDDKDGNLYNNNNAIYFEPGGTTWNEIFAQVSTRHTNGTVMSMLDTSARYRPADWLKSRKGKLAICPPCADVPNNANWANQGNGRTGFVECLNTNLD